MQALVADLFHGVLATAPCRDMRPVFVWLDDHSVWLTDTRLQRFFRGVNLLPMINGVGVQSVWRFTAALQTFERTVVRDGWMCSRILLLFLRPDPKIPDYFPLFGGEVRIDAFRIPMEGNCEHVFSFTPIPCRFRYAPM